MPCQWYTVTATHIRPRAWCTGTWYNAERHVFPMVPRMTGWQAHRALYHAPDRRQPRRMRRRRAAVEPPPGHS